MEGAWGGWVVYIWLTVGHSHSVQAERSPPNDRFQTERDGARGSVGSLKPNVFTWAWCGSVLPRHGDPGAKGTAGGARAR